MLKDLKKLCAKHSWVESNGRVRIACSECERGGNGSDPDKCACGWQIKRGGNYGCYLGQLLGKFQGVIRKGRPTP